MLMAMVAVVLQQQLVVGDLRYRVRKYLGVALAKPPTLCPL